MYKTIKTFDKAASQYEAWYKEPMGAQVLAAELRGLETLLPPEGLGSEVGAGTGVFAAQVKTDGREVICVDPSAGMLMQAAQRDLHVILGVGEALPLRRESLDFAYFIAVLEFLTDPVVALRSIRGCLKAEASLVTLTINRGSPWGELYMRMAENGDPIFSHVCLYEMDEVIELLEEADFEPVEAWSTLTNPPSAEDVGIDLVPPDSKAGVVLVKSVKKA